MNIISPDNNNSSVNVGIHVDVNLKNDDNIEINGNDVTITLANDKVATPFYFYHNINVLINSHSRLKSVIELITALKTDDKPNILLYTLFLALHQQPLDLNAIHYSKSHGLCYDLDLFASKICGINKSIQEQINDAIEITYYPDNDLVLPCLIKILKELKSICTIEGIYNDYLIIFDKDIEYIINQISANSYDLLILLANEIVRSEINLNLTDVTPIITLDNSNNFVGTWNIPDLLSALYLDIYLKQSSNTIYKKCSNPTCGLFFEVNPDKTVKKYCSTRCAQLMAKRKQREREKELR